MGQIIFEVQNGNQITPVIFSNGVVISLFAVVLSVMLVFYLLRGIGLYVLAKRQNVKGKGLAFVPCAWVLLVGRLTGKSSFFGIKTNKLNLITFIVVTVLFVLNVLTFVLIYYPIIYCWMIGGTITLGTSGTIYAEGLTFSSTVKIISMVIGYVAEFTSLAETLLLITLFFNFFKKYWPEHNVLAGLLSVFGLFGICVFIVRNNKPVDYNEWVRQRYAAQFTRDPYGNPYNPYGQQSRYNGTNQGRGPEDPFSNFNEKKDQEPFSEFSDDNKD